MNRHSKLKRAVKHGTGERAAHRVLKQHPEIIYKAVSQTGHLGNVISEFELGNEVRADFVVLEAYTLGWLIHFIELEPPAAQLFTKKMVPAKRLAQAMGQIDAWKLHANSPSRESYLRIQLSDAVQNRDLMFPDRHGTIPTCSANVPLADNQQAITYYFHIVMGERSALTVEEMRLKANYKTLHDVQIMSYDRLLEIAHSIDGDPTW